MRQSHSWGARNPRVLRSSTSKLDDPCDSGGQHRQVWANPSVRDFLWRLVTVNEFTGTWAARESSGSGHEACARCRPGSLGLGGGQLPMIRTPWMALSVVGEQRGPDFPHSETKQNSAFGSQHFTDCGEVRMLYHVLRQPSRTAMLLHRISSSEHSNATGSDQLEFSSLSPSAKPEPYTFSSTQPVCTVCCRV